MSKFHFVISINIISNIVIITFHHHTYYYHY